MHTFSRRRRVFLTAILAIGLLLLAIVIFDDYSELSEQARRATPNAATPTRHQTYQFQVETPPRERIWHFGQGKVFRWDAAPMGLSDASTPKRVVLVVDLYGPFPTFQDADQQITRWFNSLPGTVTLPTPALTSMPLTTDDWSNQPQQTIVSLPATLASGYYIWYARATTEQSPSSGTALTVQITSIRLRPL